MKMMRISAIAVIIVSSLFVGIFIGSLSAVDAAGNGIPSIWAAIENLQNQINGLQAQINNINIPSNQCLTSSTAGPQLTSVSATPSNPTINTQSDYVITFAITTALRNVGCVEITFPSGFDLTNARMLSVNDGIYDDSFTRGTLIISGQTLIWDHDTAERPACCVLVTMTIGDITNGSTQNNQISVTTRDEGGQIVDGPTSAMFELT